MTEADIPDFWKSKGDVAAVAPADLKAVYGRMRDMKARAGQNTAISSSTYAGVCSPGADTMAVWYRASMLGLLEMLPQVSPQMFPESSLTPWTHNGELDDAVFQVAATFPMKNMGVGVVHDGLPFDVEEFLKQIRGADMKATTRCKQATFNSAIVSGGLAAGGRHRGLVPGCGIVRI